MPVNPYDPVQLYTDLKTAMRDVVRDYGARGDGVSDDTAAVAQALAEASTSGGVVFFPPGVYSISSTLMLSTGVWMVGAGYKATILMLKNGANVDLVQTANFSTLTGTNNINTPFNFGILNMTLDGNKANNPSGGNCLSIYAYGYTLRDLRIRNANNYGLWSEWASSSSSPGNDSMEAFVTDFKIHDCKGGGIYFKGPHDTQFHNGIVYNNGNGTGTNAITIPSDQYGSGSVFGMIHVWGGNYDYAVKNSCTGITFADCQLEGSLLAEVWMGANNCNLFDCKIFSLEPLTVSNVVKGILIANSAVNLHATCKMENIGGGVVDFTNSGGDHHIEIFADYYTPSINVPSPGIIGSVDAQSTFILHFLNASGISTSDSTLSFPGAIKNSSLNASGSFAGGVGVNTGPNGNIAFLIGTGGDGKKGFVIFANSSSQSVPLFSVQNASFVDQVTIDKSGNVVQQGLHAIGQSATAPDPGAGGTVATASVGVARVSPAASRTACVLAAGTVSGQEVWVINESASFTLSWATAATSNIAGEAGGTFVLAAKGGQKFVWSSGDSLWHKAS